MATISGTVTKRMGGAIFGAKVTAIKQQFGIESIPNMALWLKASDGVIVDDSDNVGEWQDQSGKGNHALQTDLTYQPVLSIDQQNNKPAVYFDAKNKYLELPGGLFRNIPAIDAFVVVKHDEPMQPVKQEYLIGTSPNNGSRYQFRVNDNSKPVLCLGGARLDTENWTSGTTSSECQSNYLYVHEGIINYQSRKGKIYFDRQIKISFVLSNSSSGNTDDTDTINTIGTRKYADGTLSRPLFGYLYEMLVFHRELSDAERQNVYDYLNLKYKRTIEGNHDSYSIIDVQFTDDNGDYEFKNLDPDSLYHIIVEYEDANNKYNSESYPFVRPV